MVSFKEIWEYREMIIGLLRRDLRGRYKGSFLGFLWTFINPLFQLLVYTMVFSIIIPSNVEKYYLHLFVALIPWLFFSTSLIGGASCVLDQKTMVTKIYFPREVLPISYVTAAFVNMLYCFVIVLLVVIVSGVRLSFPGMLCLPFVMLVEYALALGFCLLLSSLSVYFRDLIHVTGIVVMAWQYLTPVMYSIDIVPESLRSVFNLNPMTPVIIAYRDILYYGITPKMNTLLLSGVVGIIFLVLGFKLFGRLKRGFAEQM